jgi:hypothetical protein
MAHIFASVNFSWKCLCMGATKDYRMQLFHHVNNGGFFLLVLVCGICDLATIKWHLDKAGQKIVKALMVR